MDYLQIFKVRLTLPEIHFMLCTSSAFSKDVTDLSAEERLLKFPLINLIKK